MAPLRKKTVPVHGFSHWYFLGGITLFLFIIQVTPGFCCSSITAQLERSF